MKKIIKKSKFITLMFISGFVAIFLSSSKFLEDVSADAPSCSYYTNPSTGECYTQQEYAIWSSRVIVNTGSGDGDGGGDGVNNFSENNF